MFEKQKQSSPKFYTLLILLQLLNEPEVEARGASGWEAISPTKAPPTIPSMPLWPAWVQSQARPLWGMSCFPASVCTANFSPVKILGLHLTPVFVTCCLSTSTWERMMRGGHPLGPYGSWGWGAAAIDTSLCTALLEGTLSEVTLQGRRHF